MDCYNHMWDRSRPTIVEMERQIKSKKQKILIATEIEALVESLFLKRVDSFLYSWRSHCCQNKLNYSGVSYCVQNLLLGKKGPLHPPQELAQWAMPIMSNTKTLSLWYLVMMVRKKLEDLQKKLFWAENSTFGPKKGHFGQSGPRNDPPSGQTATYQKTEGIQSYLRIWGTYDPIESGPSEPKK